MPLIALKSIQAKLIGFFLVLTLASLAATTGLFYTTARGILLGSLKSHLATIVANRTELIERWMGEREHDMEVLAKNTSVRDYLARPAEPSATRADGRWTALRSLLRLVRDQYRAYHELALIDLEGMSLISSNDHPRLPCEHLPAIVAAIREGRRYASPVHRDEDGGPPSLTLAVPIDTPGDIVVGAAIAHVDMGAVNDMTDAMRLMRSGEAYLVDQHGVFITHRDRRRVLRDDIAHVFGISQVVGGHDGIDEYVDYRGIRVVGAYRWLPGWRWGLMAEIDRDEAFAAVLETRRRLLVIAGLVTVVVCLGTLLVARRIVQPLQELTRAVQAVASGQLDQQLPIAGHDEVSFLTACFNQMAASLAGSRSEMDRRIHQATARLETQNEELLTTNERLARTNAALQQANTELEKQRALVARSATLAAMGEMATGIAHEINNPLTTMKNIIHPLQTGLPREDVRHKDLTIVAGEIDRISKLVRRFLRYAQPVERQVGAVDLATLARGTIDLVQPQARQKQLEVLLDAHDSVPQIRGDSEQLGQVILNLLLNAIQASPEHGRIRVFVRTIWSGLAPGQRVELGVSDGGPGIAPADHDRIFAPFYSTKADGTGLGLAISQRIVEEHEGDISFSCGPEGGTTFVVSFSCVSEGSHAPDPGR